MTDTAELERLDGILRDPLNGLTWENRIKAADAVAEVIALRAEVNRRTAAGLTMARNLTFLEGDLHKAEAEADAERLAKAMKLAAHVLKVNQPSPPAPSA